MHAIAITMIMGIAKSAYALTQTQCFIHELKDISGVAAPTSVSDAAADKAIQFAKKMGEPPPVPVIRPKPEIPITGATIDETLVNKIMGEVPSEFHATYQFLMDEIRAGRISFTEFRKTLEKSAQEFVLANPNLMEGEKFAAFIMDAEGIKKKSNLWTLELLMENKKKLGLPEHVMAYGNAGSLKNYLYRQQLHDVLIVDDASYSGMQLNEMLINLAQRHPDAEKLNVHIVIPYLTESAFKITQESFPGLNVRVYSHQILPSLRARTVQALQEKRITPQVANMVEKLLDLEKDSGLTYFDHKIPDWISSVVYRRAPSLSPLKQIIIPKGNAFYKAGTVVRPVELPYRKVP